MAELCAEHGYQETTVEELVERAGVPEAKFAELFGGDKEQCMLAAVNALTGELMSVVASNYSADRSEWDSGILGMKAILELMAAYPSFAHIGCIDSRQMASAHVAGVREAFRKVVAVMIERLWKYTDNEVQPTRVVHGALGGAEAVVRREIVAGRAEQLPRLLPDFVYGTTVLFVGQEDALRLARRARDLLRGTEWG